MQITAVPQTLGTREGELRGRGSWGRRGEDGEERAAVEEVELEEAEDVVEGEGDTIEELDVSDEEIDTEGDPELSEDGVAGGSEEALTLRCCLIHLKKSSTCQRSL